MAPALSARDIAAIVVTYRPDATIVDTLARIAAQVKQVIVVDNHSGPGALEQLRSLREVELVENSDNLGVAAALNQGVRRAAALGYTWVLTLDQDSEVDDDLIVELVRTYACCAFRSNIGLVGANARSKYGGQIAVRTASLARDFIEVKTTITSGSLLSVAAYEVTGPFREEFFIEGVDLEYCLRLRRGGYRIIVSRRPLMTHAAGAMEEHRIGPRIVIVPNHAPWRHYYATRNLLRIVGAYAAYDPAWVALALVNLGKSLGKMMLFEDRRVEKLFYTFVGAWDAVTGARRNRFLPVR